MTAQRAGFDDIMRCVRDAFIGGFVGVIGVNITRIPAGTFFFSHMKLLIGVFIVADSVKTVLFVFRRTIPARATDLTLVLCGVVFTLGYRPVAIRQRMVSILGGAVSARAANSTLVLGCII